LIRHPLNGRHGSGFVHKSRDGKKVIYINAIVTEAEPCAERCAIADESATVAADRFYDVSFRCALPRPGLRLGTAPLRKQPNTLLGRSAAAMAETGINNF
jgi:hypothetical protein